MAKITKAKCPYCKKEIELKKIKWAHSDYAVMVKGYAVFICPECNSILGCGFY